MAESPCKPSTDLTEDAEKLLEKIAQLLADQDRVKPVPNQDLFFGVTDNATNEIYWVDYMQDKCTCPHGTSEPCIHKLATKIRYGLPNPPGKRAYPKKGHSLAFNPTMAKTPVYGTKKPTRDDKYSTALHGVKKAPKRVLTKKEKEIQAKFYAMSGLKPAPVVDASDGTAISKVPLDFEEVVTTEMNQVLDAEQMSVRTDKCKIFTYHGQEKLAIYRPTNNRVVVFYKPKDERCIRHPSMIRQAALSARKDATYELCSKNKPLIHIQLKALQPTHDYKEKIQDYHDQRLDVKISQFKPDVKVELGCYCRMPITGSDIASGSKSCASCKATYHIACLKGEEKIRAETCKDFHCNPCKIPRTVEWSKDEVFNTCTFDNLLATMYIGLRGNEALIHNMPDDLDHKVKRSKRSTFKVQLFFEGKSSCNLISNKIFCLNNFFQLRVVIKCWC